MRDIIFRAWHKPWTEDGETYGGEMYGPTEESDEKRAVGFLIECDSGFENSDFVWMQYTGLNDATRWEELTENERAQWTRDGNLPSDWKGKPIYEGDIIRRETNASITVAVVKFNPAYGCPMRFRLDHEWGDNDRGAGDFLDRQTISSNIGFSVIGDIYRNPEMLKQKSEETK